MPNLTISGHTATGISFVDALLSAEGGYWAPADPTQPFSVTYSTATPSSLYELPYSSLLEPERGSDLVISETIAAAFDQAITAWANVANITVTKVADTGAVYGDIRLGATRAVDLAQAIDPDTVAYTYLPLPTNTGLGRSGDIWLSPESLNYAYNPLVNGAGYFLLLSNIGHALFGLENVSDFAGLNGARLDSSLDQMALTVMSDHTNIGLDISIAEGEALATDIWYPTTPMLLDILAVQSIYGANYNYNADNTVYSFGLNANIYQTIWDGGGFDVIDWSNQLVGGLINLQAGGFSRLGPARFDGQNFVPETLAIAFNTTIESARGGAGGDTILGNSGNNYILGNGAADSIVGNEGTDLLYGNTGNDTIYGNLDTDYLYGGVGNDVLFGGKGIDLIYGNLDSDLIYGNFERDVLFGGAGQDTIFGGGDNDYIAGNADNDVIYGNLGADTVLGDVGTDRLYGNGDKDLIYGLADNDTINGGDDDDTLYGGDGNDSILGDLEEDVIYGSAGNDTLDGGASEDILYGGEGNDILNGGAGADILDGGSGNDIMTGGDGDDVYYYYAKTQVITEAGDGYDVVYTQVNYVLGANIEAGYIIGPNSITLTGNELANVLTGNERDNNLEGAEGNDTLYGGDGADTLNGGGGLDRLYGGDGNDTYILNIADTLTGQNDQFYEDITGGIDTLVTSVSYTLPEFFENITLSGAALDATGSSGDNVLTGNTAGNLLNGMGGNDTLRGEAGADTLLGGAGDDVLIGGTGVDLFRYITSSNGNDSIQDYEIGIDQIVLVGGVSVAAQADVAGNAEITLSTGDIITVIGVASADITVTSV